MALYQFFKPPEGNNQLNAAPISNADKAVELRVNAKPSSKYRGEYTEFTPEQQAIIAYYASMHFSPTEASHTL